jgi:phosphatidylglycerophosphate synthase
MEFSKKIYKKIGKRCVVECIKLDISANEVTLFNHILTLTLGCYFFSRGTYLGNISGLLICLINGFLDYLDGDLAKATGQQSKFGEWFDTGFDVIIQNAVMGAIAIGCFKMQMPLIWIVFLFIGITGSNFVSFHFNTKFGFDSANGNELFRNYMDKKPFGINRFLKNLIDPTASFSGLAFFTFRYWITLGVIFNIMPLVFIIMTIICNLKWILMFFIYALYLLEFKNLHILNALAVLDNERSEFYVLRSLRSSQKI